MAAVYVIFFEVLMVLYVGIFLRVTMAEKGAANILISSLFFSVFFSFLAYKLCSSETLKLYLHGRGNG